MAMASLMDIIRERRSVRAYSDRPVDDDTLREITEAARLAPSACNSQCWRFVAARGPVKDRLVDEALGKIAVPNRWAKQAPVIIAACADLSFIPHKAAPKVTGIDYHLLDMGIAVEHMVLRATELGLGTCWIGWFDEGAVRRLLEIPDKVRVVSLITLGYAKGDGPREKKRLSLGEILYWDAYGRSAW